MSLMEDKESWKVRQQAILDTTSLLAKKGRILDSPEVGELVAVLRERLSESNLNLRTKVILCISQLAIALDVAIQQYTNILLPDLLQLSGDSKSSVVNAV